MRTRSDEIREFVRAVHRRMMLLRIAEGVGAGILIGCAAAALLMPILIWRGAAPIGMVALVLSAFALGGMMWGLRRVPRLLDAAIEADRQFELRDLLSTAIAIPPGGEDGWREAVRAMAARRIREVSPADLVLHRLGVRMWGGIGLAGAAVLSVSLVSSIGQRGLAEVSAGSFVTERQLAEAMEMSVPRAALRTETPPAEFRHDDEIMIAAAATDDPDAPVIGTDFAATSPSPGTPGSGAGAGRTPAAESRPPASGAVDASRHDEHGEIPAGGGGPAATEDEPIRGPAAGLTSRTPGEAADEWSTSTEPTAAASPAELLRRGRIPDAYRPLIREFFDIER